MRFRAPGKLVIVGEYAVLDGAPAIVAAVDRGVELEVTPADRRVVETPGDASYAEATLDAVGAPPGRYRFTDWNPPDTATKAGFGGSAAAVVVAALAGLSLQGRPHTPADLVAAALPVHQRLQGGGSGIDVAAAAYGGMLRFQAGAVAPLAPIPLLAVWSGESAVTGPRVRQYLAWPDRAGFVQASTAIVDRFGDDPVGAVRAAYALLAAVLQDAGIAYETPAHVVIGAQAVIAGGAAKPSGAGGGDVAVALFRRPADEARFRACMRREGYPVIDVQVAPGAHRLDP